MTVLNMIFQKARLPHEIVIGLGQTEKIFSISLLPEKRRPFRPAEKRPHGIYNLFSHFKIHKSYGRANGA